MLQVTSDLYCVIICCVIIFLKPVLDSVVCVDNCKLFHKAGIAWYGLRAENCVLASVCGRLLYWRVILICCEWLTMGKKLSKDDGNLFARRSCTCSAVTTLYMSWNFKTFSCLNRGSVCEAYALLFMSLRAFFCRRYNLLVVVEFPQAVIP